MKDKFKNGFTFIELIIGASIIALIAAISVANFRTAQKSDEINLAVDDIVGSVAEIRNLSLGGQLLADQTFPAGGYGINFQKNQNKFSVYAALDEANNGLSDGELLPTGFRQFSGIQISDLCLTTADTITALPCQTGWVNINDTLEIIFDLSGGVLANNNAEPIVGATYVGGVIRHTNTGRQGYFYVSLISGMVVGDTF